ncbi:hypothetical protein NFI96_033625 [Prochilodus magdalenae]|nr:hypothetical protein NFI96_033625 [Prochilodus magdalenae]
MVEIRADLLQKSAALFCPKLHCKHLEVFILHQFQASEFPGSKESFPNLPFENGDAAGAIELKRPVGAHCHGNKASWVENREKLVAKKKLYIASIVCLVFMIGEVIEILGALISVMSIWIVTGVLVYLAIERIVKNDYDIEGQVMLLTSGCAVVVNIIMAYILHHSTTFHAHGSGYHKIDENGMSPVGHGHSHSLLGGHGNTSVRAAFIHVLGDLLQSFGVMVAAIIIYFRPEYKVADPICTFLFSVFVLGTTITILRDVFRILMEGAPKSIEFNSVKEVLLSLKAVKAMHSLHLWALTLGQTLISVHVAIEENADPQSVLKEATELLQTKFGFYSTTIQVEPYCEDMAYCTLCQDPLD